MSLEVILVGNGSSLLDAEAGELIDSHATVCRFNDCQLKGFERHTGKRTNVWFTVMNFNEAKLRELAPKEIVVHSWQPSAEKCQTFATYAGLPFVTRVDHAILGEICAFMEDNSYRCWSTGAIAIWIMLARTERVALTGFDWWDREVHHYCDKAVRGTLHKPEHERRFIDRLVEHGKAEFL